MGDDIWASLADQFVDGAYASVKGRVRTYVMHQQLLEHLPAPPAAVLDVGGGAGHQSFPLAQAGYDVTLLDPSPAMLDKARQRLQRLAGEAQRRVTLVEATGENADEAVHGERFAAVLCHGVLGYLEQPAPVVDQLCRCAAAGGLVSIMTGNARTGAVRPALERRWDDALASFDARTEIGVLGVPGRADTVEELSDLLRSRGVQPLRWYGVWLFVDWLEFSGAELDPNDSQQVAATAAVELEAGRRDPYRQLSRVFHLVGRKGPPRPRGPMSTVNPTGVGVVVGADVDQRAARSVAQVGRVLVVVPDVPALAPVPVCRVVGSLAGVHSDVFAAAQRVGAEVVGVPGGISDDPVVERPSGAAVVSKSDELAIQAGVAAGVGAGRVVVDPEDLNPVAGRSSPAVAGIA